MHKQLQQNIVYAEMSADAVNTACINFKTTLPQRWIIYMPLSIGNLSSQFGMIYEGHKLHSLFHGQLLPCRWRES